MKKYTQMRRKVCIGLVVLSLGLTLVPLTGSLPIETKESMLTNRSDGIVISGMMGENGWYISPVVIVLNYSGEPNHTYWKLDNGAWQEYTVPICIDMEGEHMIWFLVYTQEGNVTFNASFKIDQTLPEISLLKEKTGFGQMKFVANVSDAISGVSRVEFYLDDEPLFTDYESPFETHVVWFGNHDVVAIVYDVAGLSEADNLSTSSVFSTIQPTMTPEGAARHQAHYLLFWRIRGEIKEYEMSENHWYHLNVTRMVSTSFALIFPLPFIPIPLFGVSVSRD